MYYTVITTKICIKYKELTYFQYRMSFVLSSLSNSFDSMWGNGAYGVRRNRKSLAVLHSLLSRPESFMHSLTEFRKRMLYYDKKRFNYNYIKCHNVVCGERAILNGVERQTQLIDCKEISLGLSRAAPQFIVEHCPMTSCRLIFPPNVIKKYLQNIKFIKYSQ